MSLDYLTNWILSAIILPTRPGQIEAFALAVRQYLDLSARRGLLANLDRGNNATAAGASVLITEMNADLYTFIHLRLFCDNPGGILNPRVLTYEAGLPPLRLYRSDPMYSDWYRQRVSLLALQQQLAYDIRSAIHRYQREASKQYLDTFGHLPRRVQIVSVRHRVKRNSAVPAVLQGDLYYTEFFRRVFDGLRADFTLIRQAIAELATGYPATRHERERAPLVA